MGLQRDRRGIPLQWHTLRPCRQASMLFTSTLAAHLRIGSGFRVSVQTTQEPLAEAALLDFSKKKRTILQRKKKISVCVCVCGESGAAGLCCLRFPSAAVCHMRLFLQMSCDGNLATRSPAGAAHPGADPAPGSPQIIGGRGREARESVRSSTQTQVGVGCLFPRTRSPGGPGARELSGGFLMQVGLASSASRHAARPLSGHVRRTEGG